MLKKHKLQLKVRQRGKLAGAPGLIRLKKAQCILDQCQGSWGVFLLVLVLTVFGPKRTRCIELISAAALIFSLTCLSRCLLTFGKVQSTLSLSNNTKYLESNIEAPFFPARTLYPLTVQCYCVIEASKKKL